MFRSLGASKRQVFWKLMLPSSVPIIMAGLKTAMALALIGAVVGEFISASEGVGILMQRASFALEHRGIDRRAPLHGADGRHPLCRSWKSSTTASSSGGATSRMQAVSRRRKAAAWRRAPSN